jgi:hypothetical protein
MELTKSAVPVSTSPFNALIGMFHEPTRTFAALEPRKMAWLPLVLLMLSTVALASWYFSMVDLEWLKDDMFATVKDAASREKIKSGMTRQMMQLGSIGGSLVVLPLTMAVMGLYFMIAGKMLSKEFTFGSGFALSAWSSVPGLLMFPLGAIQIFLSPNGQFSYGALNATSLNQILFQYGTGHPMAALLDSLSVPTFWSMILMVIGFQVWAKVARSTAIKVVLIPYATIYAIWLAFALNSAA